MKVLKILSKLMLKSREWDNLFLKRQLSFRLTHLTLDCNGKFIPPVFLINRKNKHLTYSDIILLVKSVTDFFFVIAKKKGLSLVFTSEVEVQNVLVDEKLIEVILYWLLSNSIEYTSEGEIEICLFQGARVDEVGRSKFAIEVTNNSFNPSDDQDVNILNPPIDTYELSLFSQYAGLLDGEIKIESELDNGFSFSFYFPAFASDKPYVDSNRPSLLNEKPEMHARKNINNPETENSDMKSTNNAVSLVSIYRDIIDSNNFDLEELRIASETENRNKIILVSHRLIGSARMVNAISLEKACNEMKTIAEDIHSGRIDINLAFEKISKELKRLSNVLSFR